MSDIPDLPPVLERLLGSGYHEQIGAFALEALPPEERIAFEAHLRDCWQCQDELPVLLDAVRVLRRAIVPDREPVEPAEPIPAESTTQPPPLAEEPSAVDEAEVEVAESIEEQVGVAAGDSGDVAAASDTPVDQSAGDANDLAAGIAASNTEAEQTSESAPTVSELLDELPPVNQELLTESESLKSENAETPAPASRGRFRSKTAPSATQATVAAPATSVAAAQTPSKLPWILGGLGLLFGIGSIIAALALAETKGNLEEEISFQNSQIAELNAQRDAYLQQTTAITWTLAPTTLGTPGSGGIVYADPAGTSAILSVFGMASLGSDQAYQVWYKPPGDASSVAGPVLTLDSAGNALATLQPDLSPYEAIAVTIEPAAGSELPSTNPVLQGLLATS